MAFVPHSFTGASSFFSLLIITSYLQYIKLSIENSIMWVNLNSLYGWCFGYDFYCQLLWTNFCCLWIAIRSILIWLFSVAKILNKNQRNHFIKINRTKILYEIPTLGNTSILKISYWFALILKKNIQMSWHSIPIHIHSQWPLSLIVGEMRTNSSLFIIINILLSMLFSWIRSGLDVKLPIQIDLDIVAQILT